MENNKCTPNNSNYVEERFQEHFHKTDILKTFENIHASAQELDVLLKKCKLINFPFLSLITKPIAHDELSIPEQQSKQQILRIPNVKIPGRTLSFVQSSFYKLNFIFSYSCSTSYLER